MDGEADRPAVCGNTHVLTHTAILYFHPKMPSPLCRQAWETLYCRPVRSVSYGHNAKILCGKTWPKLYVLPYNYGCFYMETKRDRRTDKVTWKDLDAFFSGKERTVRMSRSCYHGLSSLCLILSNKFWRNRLQRNMSWESLQELLSYVCTYFQLY
jgi:hypothetical protein